MPTDPSPPTDRDGGWKLMTTDLLPEFLEFYFPVVFEAIDFSRPVEHLEQELQKLFPASETGRGIVDKLVRVTWKEHGETLLLIHIEIQGQSQHGFAARMFEYYYRLVDRHRQPVTSLAVLADPDPSFRPTRHVHEAPGTRVVFDFSVVKLLDFKTEAELMSDPSPFALASLIQLRKLRIGSDSEKLLTGKLEMARELFSRGYSSDRVRTLFRFLDSIMRLPPELERQFESDITQEGETVVTYMSSFERRAWERGIEKGIEQGIEQGIEKGEAEMLLRQLKRKFGEVSEEIRAQIESADSEQLLRWAERFVTAEAVDELFG